jgi:hypothetical protein
VEFEPEKEEKTLSAGKQLELKKQEKIQLQDYEITFVAFDVSGMMGQQNGQGVSVGADLLASYKNEDPVKLKPVLTMGKEGNSAKPVRLPGPVEAYVSLVKIQASAGSIVLEYEGPAAGPGKGTEKTPPAFIAEVSIKPGMTVLWLGSFLILVGGSIGVFRRWH